MEVPGTVSRILWHFTGGHSQDGFTGTRSDKRKSLEEAFRLVKLVLESKELKVSKISEVYWMLNPGGLTYKEYHSKYLGYEISEDSYQEFPVCCLSDIPVQHLKYQASRYGECAIGFYRESAILHGFSPVFYITEDSEVLNSIMSGLSDTLNNQLEQGLDLFSYVIPDPDTMYGKDAWQEAEEEKEEIQNNIAAISEVIKQVRLSMKRFVSFIKIFGTDEFNTIYAEREWRSLNAFSFNENDIAMIIVPKKNGCYHDLVNSGLVSKETPVIPWEDLLEYEPINR